MSNALGKNSMLEPPTRSCRRCSLNNIWIIAMYMLISSNGFHWETRILSSLINK